MSAEQTPDIETVTSIVLDSLHYADHRGGMSMLSLSRHVAQALAPVLAAAVRDALVEAALEIWVRRYAKEGGEAVGPDTFYAGIVHAHGKLMGRADRVAEPQHEATTSSNESEAGDE